MTLAQGPTIVWQLASNAFCPVTTLPNTTSQDLVNYISIRPQAVVKIFAAVKAPELMSSEGAIESTGIILLLMMMLRFSSRNLAGLPMKDMDDPRDRDVQ